MSDYFGALMRSAGVALSGAAPAGPVAADRRAPHDPELPLAAQLPPDPIESPPTDAEAQTARSPDVPRSSPAPSSAPHAPAARGTSPGRAHRVAPSAEPGAGRPRSESAQAATRQGAHPAGDSVPLAQALVQAAVRWVRTPQDDAGVVSSAARAVDPGPLRREADGSAAVHGADVPLAPTRAQALPERAIVRAQDRVAVAQTAPAAFASAVMPSASPPVPAFQESPFEVSIGSIHLRVQAPATQTVVAAHAPAIVPAAAPAPRRGAALARRALRRL